MTTEVVWDGNHYDKQCNKGFGCSKGCIISTKVLECVGCIPDPITLTTNPSTKIPKIPKKLFWMSHEYSMKSVRKIWSLWYFTLIASWHEVGFLIHWTNVIWFTDGDGERNFLLCQKNELAIASYPFPVHSATEASIY